MNKVFLIGNLTRDIEVRETQTGKTVASLDIAVNGYNDSVDFFTVNVWGKQAENCATYLCKGRKVAIIGELHNRSFEDKEGKKRTVTEITATEVEFLSPKPNREENEEVVSAKKERPALEQVEIDLPF